MRALFKISRKLFIYYCFHVCSLEDIIKFNLSMKFELSMTISLSVVLLRTSVIPNNFHEGESARGEVSCIPFLDCLVYVISGS